MHHVLKIENHYYDEKDRGNKPFEIRHNDRGFRVGDTVSYTDVDGVRFDSKTYEITYITDFMQKPMHVVFGEKEIKS